MFQQSSNSVSIFLVFAIFVVYSTVAIIGVNGGDEVENKILEENEQNQIKDQHFKSRSLLASMARNYLTRSFSNSQVISLNLTNLFILVILKALIYAAGSLGSHHFKGRNLPDSSWKWPSLSENELLMYMGYLTSSPGHYECLNHVACKNTQTARDYIAGAHVMIKAAKTFQNIIPYNDHYEQVVENVQRAIEFGESGGLCNRKYPCFPTQ